MSSSALKPYRPVPPPVVQRMRVVAVRASQAPTGKSAVPRRRPGGLGWFFLAVIVFMSAGLYLTL